MVKRHIPLNASDAKKLAHALADETNVLSYRISIGGTGRPVLTESKFGGVPYWPVDKMPYPENKHGDKLMLLAQVNLGDLKRDEDLPPLPESGLLQFFIDGQDPLSGMDLSGQGDSSGYRIVWHEAIDRTVSDQDVLTLGMPTSEDQGLPGNPMNPLHAQVPISLEICEMAMSPSDGRFDIMLAKVYERAFGEPLPPSPNTRMDGDCGFWDLVSDETYHLFASAEPTHSLLGWPAFIQTDPREQMMGGFVRYNTLLLQMSSEPFTAMWGDDGIANFFINSESLQRHDFSDVLFHWDCH